MFLSVCGKWQSDRIALSRIQSISLLRKQQSRRCRMKLSVNFLRYLAFLMMSYCC